MSTTLRRTRNAALFVGVAMLLSLSAAAPLLSQGAQPVGSVPGSLDACATQAEAVVAEVDKVLGPQLFTVAVPSIDSVQLVFVPGPRVAAVGRGFPVCLLGASTPTRELSFEQEWGSFDDTQAIARVYPTTLVASQVASGGTDLVMSAAAHATLPRPGAAADRTLTDLEMLAAPGDAQLVGRFVSLRNVRIGVIAARGFWIASGREEVFVLPADDIHPQPGQHVNVKGIVLQLPEHMANRLGDYRAASNEVIYIYASQFRTL